MTTVKERRIPFSPAMVRAKREGFKTQTRRMVKHNARGADAVEWVTDIPLWPDRAGATYTGWVAKVNALGGLLLDLQCPYGVPGDILLTTEAWRAPAQRDHQKPSEMPKGIRIWYEADGPPPASEGWGRLRHGRFMMGWMVRDRDEITDVRVERVQDISEADILAEGVTVPLVAEALRMPWSDIPSLHDAWRLLWDSINGAGSWNSNPWVWALTFRPLKGTR